MADLVFFDSTDAFDAWLDAHPDATEVWVGYYRKSTKRPSITWSDSVDVALCHGWIDGVRKSIDDQSYKIRFTPRKKTSIWSAVNVRKVGELVAAGKMRPAGLALFNARTDAIGYKSEDRNIPLSPEFEAKIKANAAAWDFLNALAPSYRRDSIWWVMSAKREDTRVKRLGVLIESCEAGLKIPSMRKKG